MILGRKLKAPAGLPDVKLLDGALGFDSAELLRCGSELSGADLPNDPLNAAGLALDVVVPKLNAGDLNSWGLIASFSSFVFEVSCLCGSFIVSSSESPVINKDS